MPLQGAFGSSRADLEPYPLSQACLSVHCFIEKAISAGAFDKPLFIPGLPDYIPITFGLSLWTGSLLHPF